MMQLAPVSATLPVAPVPVHASHGVAPISVRSKDGASSSAGIGAAAALAAASYVRLARCGKVCRGQQMPQHDKEELGGSKKSKKPEAKKSQADPAFAAFKKNFLAKHGEGSIISLQKDNIDVPTFSTGALTLDLKLGGGLPYGRIIEVFGPEQSGKTTLALSCAHQVQMQGTRKRVAFIDAEQALDTNLATNMGVDLSEDRWSLISADFAEEACDQMLDALGSKCFDLVILDSVAALTPREEMEKDMSQSTIGLLARNMSKFLRKAAKVANDSGTCLLLINQVRANIGGYGNPETTCGGKALPYFASMRLEVRSPMSGKIGPAEESTGIKCVVRIKKNKLAAPHRRAEYDIIFGKGISWESSVVEAGIEYSVITKAGAWLSYGEQRVQGKEKMRDLLTEDPDLCKSLEADIRAAASKGDAEEDAAAEEEPKAVETTLESELKPDSKVADETQATKLKSNAKAAKDPEVADNKAGTKAKLDGKAPDARATVAFMKEKLKGYGLRTTGSKAELEKRLEEHEAKEQPSAA